MINVPRLRVGQEGGNGLDDEGIPAEGLHLHARLLQDRRRLRQEGTIAGGRLTTSGIRRRWPRRAPRGLGRLPFELLEEDPLVGGVLIDEEHPLRIGKYQVGPRHLTDIGQIGKRSPLGGRVPLCGRCSSAGLPEGLRRGCRGFPVCDNGSRRRTVFPTRRKPGTASGPLRPGRHSAAGSVPGGPGGPSARGASPAPIALPRVSTMSA